AQSPPDIRSLQNRCDVLEKQVERLEEERSGNIVRATVAEEQVTHLSEQLVALTQQYRKQGAKPLKGAGGNYTVASNVLILTFHLPTMRSLAHLLAVRLVCFVHGEEFSPDRCWAYGYTYNFCCLSDRSKACWRGEYNHTSCCAQPILDTEIAGENRTIFLTEALGPKIDFPDINCELYEEWKEFRALAWAALGAELIGVETMVTIWGPRLLGEACMENAASCGGYVAQCRVGNSVVAMNIMLSCLNQVKRASGSDAMHCIAWFDYFVSIWNGIDYNILMATRWPVLETFERLFFTVHGLRAERRHISEECDVDWPIDWITLRDFTSNVEFSGYNETVLKIISHHSLTEPPSQLRDGGICRPGLAIVCILKLWLCAASEPSCVHAYGDYLMQNELKWNDGLSLIDWLAAEEGWNIPAWLRRMLRQSARHEMELGITLTDRIILGVDGSTKIGQLDRAKLSERIFSDGGGRNHDAFTCRQACRAYPLFGVAGDCLCLRSASDSRYAMQKSELLDSLDDEGEIEVHEPITKGKVGQGPIKAVMPDFPAQESSSLFAQLLPIVSKIPPYRTVLATMVWGQEMSRHIPAFASRARELRADNDVIVYALDGVASRACENSGLHFVTGGARSSLQKYILVLALLQLDRVVMWIDFDAYWYRHPAFALPQNWGDGVEILSAVDFNSEDCLMNAMFAIRPSPRTRHWLLALSRWVYARPYVHCQVAWIMFLGIVAPVGRDVIPPAPAWATLDPDVFVNALLFDGLGWSGNYDRLAVFHFFYGWNSGAGLEMTAIYTLPTYRNLLLEQDASDIFDLVYRGDDVILHEVLELSIAERPKELKRCRESMSSTDLNLGIKPVTHVATVRLAE
ncbi:hypothetical protein FOZ60_012559, partial [Perkinsus olseni]